MMSIPCRIEFEDGSVPQRRPHRFACVPRIGDHVSLDWDGEHYPKFVVISVLHIPEGVEEDGGISAALRVKSANW